MKFRLPKLDVFVKYNEDDSKDFRNYIRVVDGKAIAFSETLVSIVDLREYLKREMRISNETELAEMDEILESFEGKFFYPEMWKALTKTCYVTLTDDLNLEVDYGTYSTVLYFTEPDGDDINFNDYIKAFMKKFSIDVSTVHLKAISGQAYSLLYKAFSSEMKGDNIFFHLGNVNQFISFSLQRRDYIYGAIFDDSENTLDITAFDTFLQFKNDIING